MYSTCERNQRGIVMWPFHARTKTGRHDINQLATAKIFIFLYIYHINRNMIYIQGCSRKHLYVTI